MKLLFSELAYSQARRDQLAQVIPAAQVARMTTVFATLKQRGILVDWPDTQIYQVLWSMVGGAAVNYLFFFSKSRIPSALSLAFSKSYAHEKAPVTVTRAFSLGDDIVLMPMQIIFSVINSFKGSLAL